MPPPLHAASIALLSVGGHLFSIRCYARLTSAGLASLLVALRETESMGKYLSELDSAGWLAHVEAVIACTVSPDHIPQPQPPSPGLAPLPPRAGPGL